MFKLASLLFTIVAVTVDSSLALSDEQQAVLKTKILEYGLGCFETFPVSVEDLNSFKDRKFPKGENAKCLVTCMFKKFGLVDDKGLVSKSVLTKVKKHFNDAALLADLESIVDVCQSVNEKEVTEEGKGCDRAELVYDCLNENAAKFGFNIDF